MHIVGGDSLRNMMRRLSERERAAGYSLTLPSLAAAGTENGRAEEYPLWPTGLSLRLLLRFPSWLVGLLAFAGYWGIPCVMAAWNGTLMPTQPPPNLRVLFSAVLGNQMTDGGLAYLVDRSHFLFSLLLGFEATVVVMILRRMNSALATLRREGLPTEDRDYPRRNNAAFRRLANHPLGRLTSLVLAMATFVGFFHFYRDDEFSYWWGSSIHGHAGLVFAAIEFFMVYYATQAMLLVVGGSLMLAKTFGNGLQLRPFHPDGCNGLSPVGTLIFLLWVFALLLAAAIFVAMFLGYLGFEKTQLAWALAIFATLTVPFAAIVPLVASIRSTMRARESQLRELEPLLNDAFARTVSALQRGEEPQWLGLTERFGKLQEVHDLLSGLNIWPFNPRALTLIMSVYAVQTIVTLHEFVGSLPF